MLSPFLLLLRCIKRAFEPQSRQRTQRDEGSETPPPLLLSQIQGGEMAAGRVISAIIQTDTRVSCPNISLVLPHPESDTIDSILPFCYREAHVELQTPASPLASTRWQLPRLSARSFSLSST
jgi:hypothetical protein